jgi:nucleoid DNA-binding protein
MKRSELARELAQRQGVPEAEARDRVDEAVHAILHKLKQGKAVSLPGIGKLVSNTPQDRK